jgi:hypothetical protein
MNTTRLVAIALIVAGILGLAYGGFSYREETHHGSFGPMEFSMMDTKTVNVPAWAGISALVVGGFLLLYGAKRQ